MGDRETLLAAASFLFCWVFPCRRRILRRRFPHQMSADIIGLTTHDVGR